MGVGKLSIVIVNYNNPGLLDACLKSIDEFLVDILKEVIIVDNNSMEHGLASHQANYSYLKVIYLPENVGFGYANNVGVKNATGDVLLLLNSDVEFIDTSFKTMLEAFFMTQTPELWGPRLIWPGGKFQQSYSREIGFIDFLTTYTAFRSMFKRFKQVKSHKYQSVEFSKKTEVDVIYGTAVLIKKTDYEKLGGFLKKYFMYFEDVDLCDRFRKVIGGCVKFDPTTTLIHKVKGSSAGNSFNLNFIRSQYIYGCSKYGYFPMAIIFVFDIILNYMLRSVAKKTK